MHLAVFHREFDFAQGIALAGAEHAQAALDFKEGAMVRALQEVVVEVKEFVGLEIQFDAEVRAPVDVDMHLAVAAHDQQ